MPKRPRLTARLIAKLRVQVLRSRRRTVYRMLRKRHAGVVPCFVCGLHVHEWDATLEHVMPLSRGGTDAMENLAISHEACNQARGSDLPSKAGELR